MMSDQIYKGLYPPEEIKEIVTAVCPSKPVELPFFSKEAKEFWVEGKASMKLYDVWELVNKGDAFEATPLWKGVSVELTEKLIDEREKAGITTQRFNSHRVF